MSIEWDKVAVFGLAGLAMYEVLKENPQQFLDRRPVMWQKSPLDNASTPMTNLPDSNHLPHPIVSAGRVVVAGDQPPSAHTKYYRETTLPSQDQYGALQSAV